MARLISPATVVRRRRRAWRIPLVLRSMRRGTSTSRMRATVASAGLDPPPARSPQWRATARAGSPATTVRRRRRACSIPRRRARCGGEPLHRGSRQPAASAGSTARRHDHHGGGQWHARVLRRQWSGDGGEPVQSRRCRARCGGEPLHRGSGNQRIRRVDPAGHDHDGSRQWQLRVLRRQRSGDGGEPGNPVGVALDAAGNLYIADRTTSASAGSMPSGVITTVAGNGTGGFSGDGGPATAASLNSPRGVALDAAGNLYIADLEQPAHPPSRSRRRIRGRDAASRCSEHYWHDRRERLVHEQCDGHLDGDRSGLADPRIKRLRTEQRDDGHGRSDVHLHRHERRWYDHTVGDDQARRHRASRQLADARERRDLRAGHGGQCGLQLQRLLRRDRELQRAGCIGCADRYRDDGIEELHGHGNRRCGEYSLDDTWLLRRRFGGGLPTCSSRTS